MGIQNILPKNLIRFFIKLLIRTCLRIEVNGLENYAKLGKRGVIVCNHQSFLDPAIIALFLPGSPSFAINKFIAQKKIFKPFLSFAPVCEVDPSSPLGIRDLVDIVKQDKQIVIFPEGRITVTGALMKFYDGPALISDKTGAEILPIVLENCEYTKFSKMGGKVKLKWFPKIRMTVFPPIKPLEISATAPKVRRRMLADHLYEMMCSRYLEARQVKPLFTELVDAAHKHGFSRTAISDVSRVSLTYKKLILKSLVLGETFSKTTNKDEAVGVLLPTSNAGVVSIMALLAYGRVPAMLNFSAGAANLVLACETAKIRRVYTSRKFIEMGGLQAEVEAISKTADVVYLEDLAKQIGIVSKLKNLLKVLLKNKLDSNAESNPEKPAFILFTSGSEGVPKGVVLSHKNLATNQHQMATIIDFGPWDTILNVLPIFHSFGLMAGTLLPLLSGARLIMHPSPLHYRIIPEIAYDCRATIMFGTDTFLSKYAKYAHPYDFSSIRYIFAGAEKLKEETRKMWLEKFGVRIFQGYGVTETAPVVSVNTAMENRAGTVGKFIPGMEYELLPVEGITNGGRLYVKGPNVMLGYMKHEKPGVIQPTESEAGTGWHDTGDIVEVDEDGFITIAGRAKRFAKIGGEMVSLGFVEQFVSNIWPEKMHAALAKADPKKGEQIVLITTEESANMDTILAYAKKEGIAELFLPKKIMVVKELPLLGTGKADYMKMKTFVE